MLPFFRAEILVEPTLSPRGYVFLDMLRVSTFCLAVVALTSSRDGEKNSLSLVLTPIFASFLMSLVESKQFIQRSVKTVNLLREFIDSIDWCGPPSLKAATACACALWVPPVIW